METQGWMADDAPLGDCAMCGSPITPAFPHNVCDCSRDPWDEEPFEYEDAHGNLIAWADRSGDVHHKALATALRAMRDIARDYDGDRKRFSRARVRDHEERERQVAAMRDAYAKLMEQMRLVLYDDAAREQYRTVLADVSAGEWKGIAPEGHADAP